MATARRPTTLFTKGDAMTEEITTLADELIDYFNDFQLERQSLIVAGRSYTTRNFKNIIEDFEGLTFIEDAARKNIKNLDGFWKELFKCVRAKIKEESKEKKDKISSVAQRIIDTSPQFEGAMDLENYTLIQTSTGEIYLFNLKENRIDISPNINARTYLSKMSQNDVLAWRRNAKNYYTEYNPKRLESMYKKDGHTYFNRYCAPRHYSIYRDNPNLFPNPKIPNIIGQLLDSLAPDKFQQNQILSWLAGALSHKKNEYALYLHSNQEGIGKGTFLRLVNALVGEQNYCPAPKTVITKEFNSYLKDKTLVSIDEATIASKTHMDRFKVLLGDKTCLEAKGVNVEDSILLYCNFILANNHLRNIWIPWNSRRFLIPQLNTKTMRDQIGTPKTVEIGEKIDILLETSPPEEDEDKKKIWKQMHTEKLEFFYYLKKVHKNPHYDIINVYKGEKFWAAIRQSLPRWQRKIYDDVMKGVEEIVLDKQYWGQGSLGLKYNLKGHSPQDYDALYEWVDIFKGPKGKLGEIVEKSQDNEIIKGTTVPELILKVSDSYLTSEE